MFHYLINGGTYFIADRWWLYTDGCHLDTPAQCFPIRQQLERLLDDLVALN